MNDVIERVQDDFINAGIDEQVLLDMKHLWEQKLIQSRVLQHEFADAGLTIVDQSTVVPIAHAPSHTSAVPSHHNKPQVQQPPPPKPRKSPKATRTLAQVDGQFDDDHPDNNSGDDDDEEDDEEEDDEVESDGGDVIESKAGGSTLATVGGDELLGSDLDDDDDEEEDAVDEEAMNKVLCQYEKVHRSKNKWKCVLKDGIMNVNGHDYVFHRAQCDFEF